MVPRGLRSVKATALTVAIATRTVGWARRRAIPRRPRGNRAEREHQGRRQSKEERDEIRTAPGEPRSLRARPVRARSGLGRRGGGLRLELDGGARGRSERVPVALSVLGERPEGLWTGGVSDSRSADLAGVHRV